MQIVVVVEHPFIRQDKNTETQNIIHPILPKLEEL